MIFSHEIISLSLF